MKFYRCVPLVLLAVSCGDNDPISELSLTGYTHPTAAESSATEVHVVSAYGMGAAAVRDNVQYGATTVEVSGTSKPIKLVLCSQTPIVWTISLSDGANIQEILVSVDKPLTKPADNPEDPDIELATKSIVEGYEAPTVVTERANQPCSAGWEDFSAGGDYYPDFIAEVRTALGQTESSFQGGDQVKRFSLPFTGETWDEQNTLPADPAESIFATLDSSLAQQDIVISENKLTASVPASVDSVNNFVLASPARSSGKHYFEITLITYNAANTYDGIGFGTERTNRESGIDRGCFLKLASGSSCTYSGLAPTPIVWSSGDVIGVALDLGNRKVYVRRNGTWIGSSDNPVTGTGGASFDLPRPNRAFQPVLGVDSGDTFTANFGASAFRDAAPSGYRSGF